MRAKLLRNVQMLFVVGTLCRVLGIRCRMTLNGFNGLSQRIPQHRHLCHSCRQQQAGRSTMRSFLFFKTSKDSPRKRNRDCCSCRYILMCCQIPRGGLRDKPVMYVSLPLANATMYSYSLNSLKLHSLKNAYRRPDYYHTCYCLSGLSIAQHGSRPEQEIECCTARYCFPNANPVTFTRRCSEDQRIYWCVCVNLEQQFVYYC